MPLPLYYDSLDTARRQDDVMLWRNSFKENIRCKNAIEKALAENFDGMHLKDGIIPPLAEEYGTDRLTWVLANTVKEHMDDGRFRPANKEWADGIYIPKDRRNYEFSVGSHPEIVNGLITDYRRYYKPGGRKKIGGYAKYIALRDGVERCDDSKKYAPVSYNQKQLIAKILRDYPDSAEMLEYDDYKQHPTIGNASEFISRAIEDNAHSAMRQKTYADYIATRPRAEKVGSHGLFSDEDGEIVLSEVAADLNTHEGNVWTMIVSLRREDAERLGYNNARAWQMLLRSHTQELADALRIPLEDLKWYGAFHNESHHPHIHVIAYTDDPKVGYLSKNGVEQMRSALGNHIFRDDLQHVFREQTEKRNELKKDWHALLEKILADMAEKPNTHPEIEARLVELSLRLSRTKGKKVYGYLKRDIKDLIDGIVDLLAEDENISKLYDLWYEKKYEALRTYTSEMPPKIPLSQNKEFKSIKNDIIREAIRISQAGEQKHESRTDSDTTSNHGSEKKTAPHHQTNSVRATAVTGLLKNLANTFRDKILGDDAKKLPTIDKRQRREIEEKKNAEIGYTM